MTAKSTKSKKSAQTKWAKAPQSAKPKPTGSHVPTPWLKLKQMWEAGESYEAMAKATDAHYAPSKSDPTKPTRAKIWKARNIGVNIDGEIVRFGARGNGNPKTKKGKTKQHSKRLKVTKNDKQKATTEQHSDVEANQVGTNVPKANRPA